MSYGMNAMVHNTSWVTAHFHLIFGGTVVIIYFVIAYTIWPTLTGRRPVSFGAQPRYDHRIDVGARDENAVDHAGVAKRSVTVRFSGTTMHGGWNANCVATMRLVT